MKELIYLATPYSHESELVRHNRFIAVNTKAAELMSKGLKIFSPISHTHPIAKAGDLPKGWEFWSEYDFAILKCCKALYVLKLDGWMESAGVNAEIKIARQLKMFIRYINL